MTEDNYGWEITIEPDQKCLKPRLKVRDGHLPTTEEINDVLYKFQDIKNKLQEKGFTVAPLQ